MHPGQYTVLNSADENIVKNARLDLNYHARLLDSLGLNSEHKMILHVGGVYNDKKQAVKRFLKELSGPGSSRQESTGARK